MKLLILGGTLFLGRHTTEAALARGHEVTLFNRGRTNPDLYPNVERLRGDRDSDLSALESRRWDAVIDPSGYLPKAVSASNALLREAQHYVFISSISAYADSTKAGIEENDALGTLPENAPEEVTGETYGPYKALCESEVALAFPDRCAIVRAGLIFGPCDPTDRSSYWPLRLAEGGEVLAPGRPGRPLQLIDVRDLAEWLVRLAESRTSGVFNATGPKRTLSMGTFLETCNEIGAHGARLTWVDEGFLLEEKVGPYSEMPLWVPEQYQMFQTVKVERAFAAGLRYRPLGETVRATLAWAKELPPGPRSKPGVLIPPALARAREAELLEKWHSRATHGAR